MGINMTGTGTHWHLQDQEQSYMTHLTIEIRMRQEVLTHGIVAQRWTTTETLGFTAQLQRRTESQDHLICSHSIASCLNSLQTNMQARYMMN